MLRVTWCYVDFDGSVRNEYTQTVVRVVRRDTRPPWDVLCDSGSYVSRRNDTTWSTIGTHLSVLHYAILHVRSTQFVPKRHQCNVFMAEAKGLCRSIIEHPPMHTPRQESRVGQTAATATAAFVPLVIRCASNPHFLARVASARALAALVPPTEAPDVIIELLGRLPEDEADPAIAMSAGASAHNHIHGEK